jgi:hypothetical protein
MGKIFIVIVIFKLVLFIVAAAGAACVRACVPGRAAARAWYRYTGTRYNLVLVVRVHSPYSAYGYSDGGGPSIAGLLRLASSEDGGKRLPCYVLGFVVTTARDPAHIFDRDS